MLSVPLLPQGDTSDCLPVCVDMVLRFYGIHTPLRTLRRVLRTTGTGTPFGNVVHLSAIGVQVESRYARSIDEVIRSLGRGEPVICAINTSELSYVPVSVPHAVVVIDADAMEVVINDPLRADSHQRISVDSFLIGWIERDCHYALIRPR